MPKKGKGRPVSVRAGRSAKKAGRKKAKKAECKINKTGEVGVQHKSPLLYDAEAAVKELLEKFKKVPECDTMEKIKTQLADYESNKLKSQQLSVRMGLSKKVCRFELPMDMKVIEHMSPQEYLTKYCLVCKRRQVYYKKAFYKFDTNKNGLLSLKDVERAVRDLYQNEISTKQVQHLTALLNADEDTKFDFKLFFTLCAFSERVFYSFFVTDDTDAGSGTKHELEKADFCSLKWKLHGCNIADAMKNLLGHIYGFKTLA